MSAGMYKGKSMAPGGGGRSAKMRDALRAQGLPEREIGGIIHNTGVKKYGAKKMAQYAAAGRKRAAKRPLAMANALMGAQA